MPGAFQYTGRLQRASVLGGGSAELQRKASRFHGVKEYFEHVDRVHDRMLLMLRLALHGTWELAAEGGESHCDPSKSTSQHVLPNCKIGR